MNPAMIGFLVGAVYCVGFVATAFFLGVEDEPLREPWPTAWPLLLVIAVAVAPFWLLARLTQWLAGER